MYSVRFGHRSSVAVLFDLGEAGGFLSAFHKPHPLPLAAHANSLLTSAAELVNGQKQVTDDLAGCAFLLGYRATVVKQCQR